METPQAQMAAPARKAWLEGFRFQFAEGVDPLQPGHVLAFHPDGRAVPEWLTSAMTSEHWLGVANGMRILAAIADLHGESAAREVAEGRRGFSAMAHFAEGSVPFAFPRTNHTPTQTQRNKAKALRRRSRKK